MILLLISSALNSFSGDSLPFKYCSISNAPKGTPYVAPQPPFSTYTAMAIFGLFIGAKPINTEWSCPRFCAVPVFPANFFFMPATVLGGIAYAWVFGVKKIRENQIDPDSDIKLGSWFDTWVKFIAVPIMVLLAAYTFIQAF